MSNASTIHHAANVNASLLAPLFALKSGFASLQIAFKRASLAQMLVELSDAELAQRGLTREQIPQVAFDLEK